MQNNAVSRHGTWVILMSIILGLFLSIIPLPPIANVFRPAFVVMILFYWNVQTPARVSFGTAFFCGIMLDALNGNTIGEHALALVCASLLPIKLYKQIRQFPAVQQALCILMIVLLYELILLILHGLVGENSVLTIFWYPAVSSMLLWPILYGLLSNLQARFRVA